MPKHAFQVTVRTQFLSDESSSSAGVYRFSYTITITNTGEIAAQVVARHWFITDSEGHTEQVRGLGVIGRQPLLAPGAVFEYSSSCTLRTPQGHMHGHYLCMTEAAQPFDAPIPAFALDAHAMPHESSDASAPRVLH